MMAATILVVGFIGMIEAMALGSAMMDNARRQTLAAQILNHELEQLRYKTWTEIQSLTPNTVINSRFDDAIAASGATYTLTGSVSDVVSGSLREVTFTVTWVVATSRRDTGGSLVTFTRSRSSSAWYGKYGLNLTYQRS